jgi:hypothetical protein
VRPDADAQLQRRSAPASSRSRLETAAMSIIAGTIVKVKRLVGRIEQNSRERAGASPVKLAALLIARLSASVMSFRSWPASCRRRRQSWPRLIAMHVCSRPSSKPSPRGSSRRLG